MHEVEALQTSARRRDMPDLLIRGLDPHTMSRLKEQAARNRRSMQAEARLLLESGVKPSIDEWLEMADRTRQRLQDERGVFEISSAELIREARDDREQELGDRYRDRD
jgi:plasmid stability protein